MQLQLKYNHETRHTPAAVLLRGDDPLQWLAEIDSWKIAIDKMDFFVLPASLQSAEAAGLFVIFKDAAVIKNITALEIYTCISGILFIPVNAILYPQVSDKELKDQLLWPVQVLHPSVGLIGFDKSNSISLKELCSFSSAKDTDWSFAHPGIAEKPLLHQILFSTGTAEEVMQEMKESIGEKPLFEIPKQPGDKMNLLRRILNILKTIFFSLLLGMFRLFSKLMPEGKNSSSSGKSSSKPAGTNGKPAKQNWFTKAAQWFNQNLEELQKKRNDEIERLMNLFDNNTDEALRYALPLDSPYMNRGSQRGSAKLERKSSLFNLGSLGGGSSTDTWDLGDRYTSLRTKYLDAAQKEIEKKDFKKAAYIYAHLLGDYRNAATVLEQGKHYREAAALYKDHLKDLSGAAGCLERGGLYIEAIDLYKKLQQDEKTGDLYLMLQQKDMAASYFEKSISTKINNSDYLDAARLLNEKLAYEERAKETLLLGWKNSFQYEACLRKYIDLTANDEDADAVENTVKDIYRNHTSPQKKLAFLNGLEYANQKSGSESMKATAEEMAYEIIHEQAVTGNPGALHYLKAFLPGNQLVASDTSRYNSSIKTVNTGVTMPETIQLDESVKWMRTVIHKNQFLVAGIKNNYLHLARVNWYGNTEYYSWDHILEEYTQPYFITAPYVSNRIILQTTGKLPVTQKLLPQNKYFNEELSIECPLWLQQGKRQALINKEANIQQLEIYNGNMTLHTYSADGRLIKSVNCILEKNVQLGTVHSNPHIASFNDHIYTYSNNTFFTVSPEGIVKATYLGTGIRTFAASEYTQDLLIIISTNKGCVLCRPVKGDLNLEQQWFAEKLIPVAISFITPAIFVIAEKFKVSVFEIKENRPVLIHQSVTVSPVAGILPGAERNKFGVVEENGKVSMRVIG